MQKPTLENVRIRSTRDALQIFYAVARKVLPMTTRRLDAEERRAIAPGHIYVWEERCANAEATGLGMERWTDGMGWGPSRVRDEFLFYHQRESEANDDPNNPSAKWANIMKKRNPQTMTMSSSSLYSRTEAERLIKQTYSVHVSLPEDRPHNLTRKWHLTAYFSQTTLDSLNTIDKVPGVGNVPVPPGWFRSARASKSRRSAEETNASAGSWSNEASNAPYSMSHFAVDDTSDTHSWTSPTRGAREVAYHPQHDAALAYARDFGSFASMQTSSPSHLPPISTYSDSEVYREHSPFAQSSASSDYGASTPPPLPVPRRGGRGDVELVPLAYLENLTPPSRDPMDEACLRRISAHGMSTASARFPQF
ncbi:unnamed protein product [Somion occarium]|uniref:cAMP-independent regulatory protein pac2 n=1 Tax=Somion occarium TaxID=3059160 RepID=A0ABP1DLY1_9APHY